MDNMVELVGKSMEELKGTDEERINQLRDEMGEFITDSIVCYLSNLTDRQ